MFEGIRYAGELVARPGLEPLPWSHAQITQPEADPEQLIVVPISGLAVEIDDGLNCPKSLEPTSLLQEIVADDNVVKSLQVAESVKTPLLSGSIADAFHQYWVPPESASPACKSKVACVFEV